MGASASVPMLLRLFWGTEVTVLAASCFFKGIMDVLIFSSLVSLSSGGYYFQGKEEEDLTLS